jgi:hypothetical protein
MRSIQVTEVAISRKLRDKVSDISASREDLMSVCVLSTRENESFLR